MLDICIEIVNATKFHNKANNVSVFTHAFLEGKYLLGVQL